MPVAFDHCHTNALRGGFGMLIINHEGELQTGDEHFFQPAAPGLEDYRFFLKVDQGGSDIDGPQVATRKPSQLVGYIEDHNIVVRLTKLQMATTLDALHQQSWRPCQRFLLTFSSVVDLEKTFDFTISLLLDPNVRLERHYLGLKPDHLPAPETPETSGPWHRLHIWVNVRPTKLNIPTRPSSGG